jgi:hypothetical protein
LQMLHPPPSRFATANGLQSSNGRCGSVEGVVGARLSQGYSRGLLVIMPGRHRAEQLQYQGQDTDAVKEIVQLSVATTHLRPIVGDERKMVAFRGWSGRRHHRTGTAGCRRSGRPRPGLCKRMSRAVCFYCLQQSN